MALSQKARAALWIQAGGPADVADVAAAISMSESSRGQDNPTDGGCGYWQITPPEPGCHIPLTNARQAVRKYKASIAAGHDGFRPWVQYNNGNYKQYMKGGTENASLLGKIPDLTPNLPDLTPSLNDIPGLSEIADVFKTILDVLKALFDRDTYYRSGKVILGLGLVFVGTISLSVIAINLLTNTSANITDPVKQAAGAGKSAQDVIGKGVKAGETAAAAVALAPK